MARLTSEIFISALTRRVFALGGFAAIERQGAPEAGAIFIRQRMRSGLENLFAPAPQSFFGSEEDIGRRFEQRLEKLNAAEVDTVLEKERRMDPDLWIVEIEIDDVANLLDVVKP